MDRYLNTTKAVVSFSFVAVAELLNKIPLLIALLMGAVAFDYLTGYLKAKIRGEWDVRKGVIGIIKKVVYFIIIGVAFTVGLAIMEIGMFVNLDLEYAVNIGWYTTAVMLLNELTSILENAYAIAPNKIPVWLIKILKIAGNATNDKIKGFICKNQNCDECELKDKCENKDALSKQ